MQKPRLVLWHRGALCPVVRDGVCVGEGKADATEVDVRRFLAGDELGMGQLDAHGAVPGCDGDAAAWNDAVGAERGNGDALGSDHDDGRLMHQAKHGPLTAVTEK